MSILLINKYCCYLSVYNQVYVKVLVSITRENDHQSSTHDTLKGHAGVCLLLNIGIRVSLNFLDDGGTD